MVDILLRRGTTDKISAYTGSTGEILVNTDTKTIVNSDDKSVSVPAAQNITKLSQLTNDSGIWNKSNLTKLSQLTNDAFVAKSSLTKLSQLPGTSAYKNAYCTYCTYCSNKCTSTQCNTIQCSGYCNKVTDCRYDACQD